MSQDIDPLIGSVTLIDALSTISPSNLRSTLHSPINPNGADIDLSAPCARSPTSLSGLYIGTSITEASCVVYDTVNTVSLITPVAGVKVIDPVAVNSGTSTVVESATEPSNIKSQVYVPGVVSAAVPFPTSSSPLSSRLTPPAGFVALILTLDASEDAQA